MGCLPGLEGQRALVLQETTSARTPAQGTPPPCSHWPHTAGSARSSGSALSMLSARPGRQVGGAPGSRPWDVLAGGRRGREGRSRLPCFSSGRTEKRFAGVGLPATSGDHRACWSPASAGPAHLGGSLEFVRPPGGGRRPSERAARLSLILAPVVLGHLRPRESVFSALAFPCV